MDLSSFTPDQLAALKAQLNSPGGDGRSPLRPRQLHDLRLLPTATDPRPMFVLSAEGTRDQVAWPPTFYPSLLWHAETGREVTIKTAAERATYGPEWVTVPPSTTADPLQSTLDAFASLNEEDRQVLIEAQRQDRMAVLQKKLAGLSEGDLEKLLAQTGQPEAKRGPGRPKKQQVA